ncbi:MAG TPA: N-acetyl-gamma-glutamyl-phosphate reductase, partial [Burkholderiales bacterium]|nr:N-acetyl-gamma-glutamyl-phosphate reductase [Burkholderiales bacterium]
MIKAGIVGGTGYTGVELLRLLVQHPQVELRAITSRKEAGTPVSAMFPGLRRHLDLSFTEPDAKKLGACDVVFFATPNGVAMNEARAVLDAGARIVDLSADFRIRELAEWERWYKTKHGAPELVREAVYGLCEVNREQIRGARLVANPGCYPTAVQLGFLPLVESGAVDLDHLIADAKSGVSGAGRKAELHLSYAEAADNFLAYNVPGHRHWPEIRQGLAQAARREVGLTFVPHLLPIIRGIHATLYARVTRELDFQALYEERYEREPFVDV